MTTPDALLTLRALSKQQRDKADDLVAQAESIDIAIAQLEDVLNTPAADLVAAQTELENEKVSHERDVATLTERITELQNPVPAESQDEVLP